MDLAGPPYHLDPQVILQKWTLPQMLFAWFRQQEDVARRGKQEFLLRMVAIGGALGGKGARGVVNSVLQSFDGPPLSEDEILDGMDETQRLVLYGKKRLNERPTNPNPNKE
jgi:hypothetical protein